MVYTSLRDLYARADTWQVYKQVRLPDAQVLLLPRVDSLDWRFTFGRVPTGTVQFTNEYYPMYGPTSYGIRRNQRIEFWVGLRNLESGDEFSQIVFAGHIDSPSRSNQSVTLECVGMSKVLELPYRGVLLTLDGTLSATAAVTYLLDLAGVQNYFVNLPDWHPGECCPIVLEDMTIGDAINKIAEVDGSAWYEMPSGQVRVELRDPFPAAGSERTYYAAIPLPGAVNAGEITPSPLARAGRPRILGSSSRTFPQEVKTRITIRGGTCTEIGPNGETNNIDVEASAVDPDSPFLDQCPAPGSDELGEDIAFETIDCPDKAAEVALRYLNLRDRLVTRVGLSVPGDPTLCLGLIVEAVDPAYSEITGNWFVEGYSGSLSTSGFGSDLDLLGGPDAGVTGLLAPWADFHWKKPPEAIPDEGMPPAPWNEETVLPEDGGDCIEPDALCSVIVRELQANPPGVDGLPVMPETPTCCPVYNDDKEIVDDTSDPPSEGGGEQIRVGFHAEASRDFDGVIVSYQWSDDVSGPFGTGLNITRDYDLSLSSVEVTLVVTDNDGQTATKTKRVALTAISPDDTIMLDGGEQLAEDCLIPEVCEEPSVPDPFQYCPDFIDHVVCDTNDKDYPIPIFGFRNSPPFSGSGPGVHVPFLWENDPPLVLLWYLAAQRCEPGAAFPNTDDLTGGFMPRAPFIGFDTGGFNFSYEAVPMAAAWNASGRSIVQGQDVVPNRVPINVPRGDSRIVVFIAWNAVRVAGDLLTGGSCGDITLYYAYGGCETKWDYAGADMGGLVAAYILNLECIPGVEYVSTICPE